MKLLELNPVDQRCRREMRGETSKLSRTKQRLNQWAVDNHHKATVRQISMRISMRGDEADLVRWRTSRRKRRWCRCHLLTLNRAAKNNVRKSRAGSSGLDGRNPGLGLGSGPSTTETRSATRRAHNFTLSTNKQSWYFARFI